MNNLKDLQSKMGMRLNPIPYFEQEAKDHCGSSAVLIGIEMMRIYKHQNFLPKKLTASKDLMNTIKGRLHEGEKNQPKGHTTPPETQNLSMHLLPGRSDKQRQESNKSS